MNSSENQQRNGVVSSNWLGEIPTIEGLYYAHFPKGNHTEIVRTRFDVDKGCRVVDRIGIPREDSEQLWRYTEWMWLPIGDLPSPNNPVSDDAKRHSL